MATVEVDELQFQQSEALRKTIAQLWANKDARKKLREAEKVLNPNVQTEDDIVQPYVEELNATKKQLNEYIEAQKKEKEESEQKRAVDSIQSRMAAGKSQLKREGYTDEGIKAIEDLMNAEGIVNYEIGRAYFEKVHPPPAPANPNGTGSWGFFDNQDQSGDDIKQLIASKGDNEPLLRKMVGDALNEVRGAKR